MPITGGGGPVRVPNLCVCANTSAAGVVHAGEEGRIYVLLWFRPVGVAIPPVRRKEGRAGLLTRVSGAAWYGDDSPHLSMPKPAVFRWQ